MKILHTADWHLGKKLDNFSRIGEQIEVLEEIIEIADAQQVDLILIAGDLFDNFNPSTEAVELFYKTLKRLTNNAQRPVVAISGNHDSPNLIDAPDPLARECGIILIGYPQAKVQLNQLDAFQISQSTEGLFELKLKNFDFPVRIMHTAYANEIRLKQFLGEEKEDELNRILAEHWKSLAEAYCDEKGVNLLMAHLYMNQRGKALLEEPEGEKPIKIGNADMIYSDAIPPQIQYTALGHLHAFNNIATEEKPVIYASSILPYSFSEAGQQKYVNIISASPNQAVEYQKIPLQKGKQLHRKTFDDVNLAIHWLSNHPNVLVELTLESETFLKAEDRKALYQSHAGIVHLIPKVQEKVGCEAESKSINLNQNMNDLFRDYFKFKHQNQEPNEEILQLFNEILTKK